MLGLGLIGLGGLALLLESPSHSACSSGLVQLAEPNTCTSASVVWTIGLLGLVLGIVLVLIAVIVGGKPGRLSHVDRSPQSRDHGGS
jgi:hypothetical protein